MSAHNRRRAGAVLGLTLFVAAVSFWFTQLSSSAEVSYTCATPARSMAQAIDARMHDPRTHVDHPKGVEAKDGRYESLFFSSANVRVAGVFVGIGTWGSNVRDFGNGDFRGWAQTPRAYSLFPVNELARAISDNPQPMNDPGVTRAAEFSQRCVTQPVTTR